MRTFAEGRHDVQLEDALVLFTSPLLQLRTMVGQKLRNDFRDGRPAPVDRLLLGRVFTFGDGAKNSVGLLTRFLDRPPLPVRADGVPTRASVDALLQEIDRSSPLPANTETGDLRIANNVVWLKLVDEAFCDARAAGRGH